MALRFAAHFPERVERLLLVCSAGLDEKWWAIPSMTLPLRWGIRALESLLQPFGIEDAPGLRWLFAHIRLISTTPEYGVPKDMPERLAAQHVPLHLVWGRFDLVHTAQIERWRGGRSAEDVPAIVLPFSGHVQLCMRINELELWKLEKFWAPSSMSSNPSHMHPLCNSREQNRGYQHVLSRL